MARTVSEDVGAFYQHHPRMAVVVTARSGDRRNAMTVDWHTSLSRNPPLYGVAIAPMRYTYQLIAESREFGVNFLPFEAIDIVAAVGATGGWKVDKFQRFNIALEPPLKTNVPVLKAAYAAYECRLVDDRTCGDHQLLVGEIVAVHSLEEAFGPDEMLDVERIGPVFYLGDEVYLTSTGDTLRRIDHSVY